MCNSRKYVFTQDKFNHCELIANYFYPIYGQSNKKNQVLLCMSCRRKLSVKFRFSTGCLHSRKTYASVTYKHKGFEEVATFLLSSKLIPCHFEVCSRIRRKNVSCFTGEFFQQPNYSLMRQIWGMSCVIYPIPRPFSLLPLIPGVL